MSGKRYTEEFKVAAVKQVVDRGHPAAEVAEIELMHMIRKGLSSIDDADTMSIADQCYTLAGMVRRD